MKENKIIVFSEEAFSKFLDPIIQKLEKLEEHLYKRELKNDLVYSDKEASVFLKVSQKKLQQLRNAREIGFIRQNGGRRILYKHQHLMEYLSSNEMKKKK